MATREEIEERLGVSYHNLLHGRYVASESREILADILNAHDAELADLRASLAQAEERVRLARDALAQCSCICWYVGKAKDILGAYEVPSEARTPGKGA